MVASEATRGWQPGQETQLGSWCVTREPGSTTIDRGASTHPLFAESISPSEWIRMGSLGTYGASLGAGPYYGATGMEQQALAPYQVGISNSLHMYTAHSRSVG